MKRPDARNLLLVISLVASVIWHGAVFGATVPALESLGQIRDYRYLEAPLALDVDASGNLYVADAVRKTVSQFDIYGELVRVFDSVKATGRGLAVTPDGGTIYVSTEDSVAILDARAGLTKGALGSPGSFVMPGEIDLDASGFVFAADLTTKEIKVYSPEGQFRYAFGGEGALPGQFASVGVLTVDPARGEVYVADSQFVGSSTMQPRVQVFDLSGELKRSFDIRSYATLGLPFMTFFGGIAIDASGRSYFLEGLYSQIRYVDVETSRYLGLYNKTGYSVGQLHRPTDVAYDPATGRLFVSCDGGRVEIFGVDGAQNPVHRNIAPGMPVPLAPASESEIATPTPELRYANAKDQDGDPLVYDVSITDGSGSLVASYTGLPEGDAESYAQVDAPLSENGRYLWSVRAFDGEASSHWTTPEGFWVNAHEEPPSAPQPISPLAAEEPPLLDGAGLLNWAASADPDPFDTLRYEVSVADAQGNVVLSATVAALSISLDAFADYSALNDGASYAWTVRAVDNHGLSSEPSASQPFVYDTAIFSVAANMPDARVYIGGNHAYAGQFVGAAPIESRDFAPGTYSVVVERAGFEPWVTQVQVGERENVEVYAELVPVLVPEGLNARPFEAAGEKIDAGADASPFLVDFDNDGLDDLLVGNASGEILLYPAKEVDGAVTLSAPRSLDLPLVPSAVPFVVDYDDDGRKDLLVGAADGTVIYFANIGTEPAPAFASGELLTVAGEPLDAGRYAVPAVIDIDADGDKDLVVGADSGVVALYRNIRNASGRPSLSAPQALLRLSTPVAPFFSDWDGDGDRELLLAAGEHLYRYLRNEEDVYRLAEVLTVGSGGTASGASLLGANLRLFACDVDRKGGKDLLVGNASGAVRLVYSLPVSHAPTLDGAIVDKIAQIEGVAVNESTSEELARLQPALASLADAKGGSDWSRIPAILDDLCAAVPQSSSVCQSSVELKRIVAFILE